MPKIDNRPPTDQGLPHPTDDLITRQEFEDYKQKTLKHIEEIHQHLEKSSESTEALKDSLSPLVVEICTLSTGIEKLQDETLVIAQKVEQGLSLKQVEEQSPPPQKRKWKKCLPPWLWLCLLAVFGIFLVVGFIACILPTNLVSNG